MTSKEAIDIMLRIDHELAVIAFEWDDSPVSLKLENMRANAARVIQLLRKANHG